MQVFLEKMIITEQLSCQFKMAEESTRLFQGSKIFTVAFVASFCPKSMSPICLLNQSNLKLS